jgi:dihydrofolate reductase
MVISLIAAMSENRVIGHGKNIPWHIPEEQRLFRRFTLGSSVVMGRKTFESIGKPLEKRMNIVVSRKPDYKAEGCLTAKNLHDAIEKAGEYSEEVFIIGGESLFRESLPFADRIYLTRVHITVYGDAFFPEFNPDRKSVV